MAVRHCSNTQFKIEKDKYLKMPLDEKRRFYTCKNFTVLSDIKTQLDKWRHSNVAAVFKIEASPTLECQISTNGDSSATRVADVNGDCPASKVSLWKGDITAIEVDAIVNAANSRLIAGGGVDGAIHRAAGEVLDAECNSLGGCPTGEARITGGYLLPAKYVIHTVGPMDEDEYMLRRCYVESLRLLRENSLRCVAFPCISTGVYGFPHKKAANVALKATAEWLAIQKNIKSVDRIIFCVFLEEDHRIYEQLLPQYFPAKG